MRAAPREADGWGMLLLFGAVLAGLLVRGIF